MSFPISSRYVPHSETTKAHYERLLLDLRRCLPPGVDDDIEEIAEETLAIVCAARTASGEGLLEQQQRQLERLLDTTLTRETRDHLLQYGKVITDYVVADATADGSGGGVVAADGAAKGGVFDLDMEGPSSSSSGDDEEAEEMEQLTGVSRRHHRRNDAEAKQRRKALHEDKNLAPFAFAGGPGEDGDDVLSGGEDGNAHWGAGDEEHGGEEEEGDLAGSAAPISFDDVACNAQYVKDSLRRLFPAQDVAACEAQAVRVVDFLSQKTVDLFTLETQLTAFLGGYEDEAVMDWIGDVCSSRWNVVYGLRYAACNTQKEKNQVVDSMCDHAVEDPVVERLYQSITGKEVGLLTRPRTAAAPDVANEEAEAAGGVGGQRGKEPPLRRVDLQACAFQDERSPHQHVRATVPQGTERLVFETHDEVVLPPTPAYNKSDPLVAITAFPAWAQKAFPGMVRLNPMQSKVYESAFLSDENMLVSAPTGAGKTNVAAMAMLRAVQNATNPATGEVNLRELKMVYVAPMKALVQEVVRTFSQRLEPLGLTVAELSGDSAMTQQQMAETQLIVTTPEKWDIVTRKSVELGVASLLSLLIIDEVHLLHNERGPVLEAIVARTMLQQQLRGAGGIRIVGLSATLPNYDDVAAFLQVDRQRGLFVFDNSYRPIPLEQTYCAVKKVKGMNQAAVMNRVVYDKVLQAVQENEQVMIFVHSRKETEYTAQFLRQRAMEEHRGHSFVRPGSESEQVLQETVSGSGYSLRRSLQQLLPQGFAIHHAGLSREERQTVEQLFGDRHIRVLVCTSTLAWGVNLPANRVIIKGTRVFNGAKGESELLSALDVLQMFGRAGRVGFGASVGRAAIITSPDDLHYYLCVLNQQLPIESQTMKRVVDMLNAEVTLGHIENTKEGVQWLQRTYLYVRMRKVPEVYGIRPTASDPLLLHHLENIVHTACEELRAARMVEYDAQSRKVGPTPYGRIASHCYVTTTSMSTYLSQITPAMQEVDLFRVFAMSSEFANISVRAEEQAQLKDLLESAPVAVRESRYTPLAKINILLQCYISRKNLDGLPLMSEIVYIKDSAQRILRALYEICIVREFGRTARQFLELYLMVLHRQWSVQSPVRQVQEVVSQKNFSAVLPTLERVRVSWEEVRQWSEVDLAEKLSDDRRAAVAHECIHAVPHYVVEATVRPLTRSMLYADIDITPDFTYHESLHGRSVCEVLVLVEHPSGRLLHYEPVQLPLQDVKDNATYACPPIVVPMMDPKPTHLFVRCLSPSWLPVGGATAAVSLLNTLLPPIAPALKELNQRPPTDLDNDREVSSVLAKYKLATVAEQVFPFDDFFTLQCDLVEPIMEAEQDNLFVGVPPGGGKTVLAELFVLQFLLSCAVDEGSAETSAPALEHGAPSARKLIYVTSNDDVVRRRLMEWKFKFGGLLHQRVAMLEQGMGEEQQDAHFAAANIIVTTGANLLPLVRRGASVLSSVTHVIVDHLHLLRGPEGRYMEECLARLNTPPFLVRSGRKRARVLALSYPLISCAEVCRWLRIPAVRQFNYGTSFRQLRVRTEVLDQPSARGRYETSVVAAVKLVSRPPYNAVPGVLFVPHAREAEEVAKRVLLRCRDGYIPGSEAAAAVADRCDDPRLALLLAAGVGYLHRGTSSLDVLNILDALEQPATIPETNQRLPLILVCSFDAAWRLPAALFSTAVVCSAERASAVAEEEKAVPTAGGASRVPTDCSASELLQMVSRAANEAVVYCRPARRWVWSHLLNEPLPLESNLRYPEDFRDAVNAAVAQGRATTRSDVLRVLQSHYFLYHLKSHLHYYGVPTVDDIPLFASDFAARVVEALRENGCVSRPVRSVVGGEGDADEGDDDDSPHAPVRPTLRGVAVAHHGLTMDTVDRLTEAVAAAVTAGRANSVAAMWRIVANHCDEFSPLTLGDAVRITEAAEYRALHTIARALPAKFKVSYTDLDFSRSQTKVYLLVLAHCARFFRHPPEDEGVVFATAQHPLAHVSDGAASPADSQLLAAIAPATACRLEDDLHQLLPTVARTVAAAAELLDGRQQWQQVRYLMHLEQCLQQRVWTDEDGLAQLPIVQEKLSRSMNSIAALQAAAPQLTLSHLQAELSPQAVAGLARALQPDSASKRDKGQVGEGWVAELVAEARHIPVVRQLTAVGAVREEDGVLAFVVELTAELLWTPPDDTSTAATDEAADLDGTAPHVAAIPSSGGPAYRWWLSCFTRRKDGEGAPGGTSRLMALRRVEHLTSASSSSSPPAPEAVPHAREFRLSSQLLFPLSRMEEEDLELIDLVVAMTSQCYRVDAETLVQLSPPATE